MGSDVCSSPFYPPKTHYCFSIVSVDFFDDVYIPLIYLPEPCALYVQSSVSTLPLPIT